MNSDVSDVYYESLNQQIDYDSARNVAQQLYAELQDKLAEMETMEAVCQAYCRNITEKDIIIRQYQQKIKRQTDELTALRFDNNRLRMQLEELKCYLNFCWSKMENRQPTIQKSWNKSKASIFQEKQKMSQHSQCSQNRKPMANLHESQQKDTEYTIQTIKLKKNISDNKERNTKSLVQTQLEIPTDKRSPGEFLAEDFLVIGPDANDISIEKMKNSITQHLQLKPTVLYSYRGKSERADQTHDILLRTFPNSLHARKLKNIEYDMELRRLIEYLPSYKLNNDYFVFTIRGQDDLKPSSCPSELLQSNINKSIYILCLKLKDIVVVKSNNNIKHSNSEYWLTEKVYVLMSFYPIFDGHMRFMVELERQNILTRLRCLQKDQGKSLSIGNIDVRDFVKSQNFHEGMRQYVEQKISGMAWIKFLSDSLVSIPQGRHLGLLQAGYACGYVFSNICYEQFLVILTAILCQKTVVFVSKSASLSSFTALTFLGLIFPFQYQHPQILNADSVKIKQLIFQSPWALVASISTNDLDSILQLFLDANLENEKSPYILVDLDSGSILLDKSLRTELARITPIPKEELRHQYLLKNKSKPRSVPLTKELMGIQSGVFTTSVRRANPQANLREEKRKQLQREYKDTLMINECTKLIDTEPDYELVKMFRDFVEQFSIKQASRKVYRVEQAKQHFSRIKRKLLEQNPSYRPFLQVFMDTQIFNSHLDTWLHY